MDSGLGTSRAVGVMVSGPTLGYPGRWGQALPGLVGYLCGGFLEEEGREEQIAKAEWRSSQGASPPDHLAEDPDAKTYPFQSGGVWADG